MMMVIVSYDVNTETASGKKRLRHVAKICNDYGQRVQNSVFELNIDNKQFIELKNNLLKIIHEKDSVRFYKLGNNYKNDIEVIGSANKIEIKDNNAFIF